MGLPAFLNRLDERVVPRRARTEGPEDYLRRVAGRPFLSLGLVAHLDIHRALRQMYLRDEPSDATREDHL
jgi:hypothetical protein